MKKALALLAALALAAQADARALFITPGPTSANQITGVTRISEAAQSMANTLGGSYDVRSMWDAQEGATDALRRGVWYPNGVGLDSILYGLVVILGDDKTNYTGTITNCGRETSVGGIATIHTTNASAFQFLKPGALVSGTGITGRAKVLSIDSLYQTMRVSGTVAGGGNITLTWASPVRPDSLTLTYDATNGYRYPKVTFLRLAQFMGTTSGWTTATTCSTGVGATAVYAAAEDSTVNVYEVGNPYRTWKARGYYATSSPKDPRGFRAILARHSTRLSDANAASSNYDFVDPLCVDCATAANSSQADTVALWMIQNRSAGLPIGGDAKENIYAVVSHVNGTNGIDPGVLLSAFAIADSLSGGALFGASTKLPRQMGFHIDDGWKRGNSNAGLYGGIACNDTTALVASIDSLASLGIPFVVGVECDSLDSVLLAAGTTGNGKFYDQRWWARAPLAHYTPHCHAGLVAGTNREQNNATKYLRPLDLWGLSRTRYAFGSVDSLIAYGTTDYVNDVADSAASYWLSKRAKAMCDSVFGAQKVDGLVMPPGDDWTVTSIKHTRQRQHGLGVDSVFTAMVMSGMSGVRANAGGNVVGNDDSTTTNNYGYYPTWFPGRIGPSAGSPGMPSWTTARYYGLPCPVVPTDGYPTGASAKSWSQNRLSYGGEKFLNGLLLEHVDVSTAPTAAGRAVFVLASHAGDFGSSNPSSGLQTRPMFYTFKYVTNAVRVANAHALRPLVQFVYPDGIRP